MGKYNIPKLSRRFFPWFWQSEENLSLIDTLMSSLNVVNDRTVSVENDIRQKAGYSIQRLSLEISLNDKFDPVQRRIVVEQGDTRTAEYVFNEAETPAEELIVYVFNEAETPAPEDIEYFYNVGESSSGAITGFSVFVPSLYQGQQQEIEAWIDRVKVSGTNYNIIWI